MGAFGKQLLNIVGRNVLGVDFEAQKRQRAMQDAVMAANREAGGLMSPVPGAMRQMQIGNVEGADITDAFGPAMEQGPSRQRSPQEIAAALADLQGRVPGFNSKPFADLLTAGKRDIRRDETGNYVDVTDPSLVGRPAPKAPDGGYIVQGQNGPQTRMAQGYNDAIMATKAAETTGVEAAKSGYDLIDVPDGRGGTIKMPRSAYLGMIGQNRAGQSGGMGYTPPAAQLSADRLAAENTAQGAIDLPKVLSAAQNSLGIIKQIREHPGRRLGTGATAYLPGIGGTAQKDFIDLVEQAKGGAFLTALESLKGSGQVTVIEGDKGTAAIARMNRAQSEEGFLKALDDYEAVINAAVSRATERAGGQSAPRPTQGPRTTMGRSRILSVE